MGRWIALLALIVAFAGCASFDVGRYGVSVENVAALKKLGGQKVNVGQFTAKDFNKKLLAMMAKGPSVKPPTTKKTKDSAEESA